MKISFRKLIKKLNFPGPQVITNLYFHRAKFEVDEHHCQQLYEKKF